MRAGYVQPSLPLQSANISSAFLNLFFRRPLVPLVGATLDAEHAGAIGKSTGAGALAPTTNHAARVRLPDWRSGGAQ